MVSNSQHADQRFDLIIVGAGSAGSLLTHSLATSPEFSSRSILVLEAGKDRDGDPKIDTPASSGSLLGDPEYDWCFVSEQEPGLNGRRIKQPRGKVVGGTSAINSHSLVFTSRYYHDFWAQHLLGSHDSTPNNMHTQGAASGIDWSWTGMEEYYSKPFKVQAPSAEVREKLRVRYEVPTEQDSPSTIRNEQSSPSRTTDVNDKSSSHHGSHFTTNKQLDQIQASFPAVGSRLQQSWIDTFASADFLSDSVGMDGRAFGGLTIMNAVDGRPGMGGRSHAGREFWATLNRCHNVSLLQDVVVQKIIFCQDKQNTKRLQASGIQFFHNGRSETASIKSSGEVILCAGVFGSPQILELSGIGAKNALTNAQIPCLYELPGVGENLQDHLNCGCSVELKDGIESRDVEIHDSDLFERISKQYTRDKTGPLADGWVYSVAHLPTQWLSPQIEQDKLREAMMEEQDDQVSDGTKLQYEFIKSAIKDPCEATATTVMQQRQRNPDRDILPASEPAAVPGNFVSIVTMLSHPFSRGSCHAISNECSCPPQIVFNYLTHPLDRWLFRSHLRQIDRILELAPLSQLIKPAGKRLPRTFTGRFTEIDDAALDEIMKAMVATNYHPCGTCAMMAESLDGVVDETFKVYGTSNVRVVDASVIPIVPRGNILTTVYALAAKAAAIMLAETRRCSDQK